MDVQANLRNFKDFLQLYNRMTESCFGKCVDNLNSRNLEPNEAACIEDCTSKFIKFNRKLMETFVDVQNIIVTRRIKEAEELQASMDNTTNQNAAVTSIS